MMCNKERLLDYLYNELPASERTSFEHHLQDCLECRTELAELGGTRLALASWAPPDSELGFRIVRNEPPATRRAMWSFRPAWGLAAAAVLVLAAAAAIANVEVRYDRDGFIVRSGWAREGQPASSGTTNAAAVQVDASSEQLKASLLLLDARLKRLEQLPPGSVRPATADGDRMSDVELLRAVQRIVAESESKQQRELALRVTQVIKDFDRIRATDLARVEQGLQQNQGLTDAELIQQRNQINYLLMRVTQR